MTCPRFDAQGPVLCYPFAWGFVPRTRAPDGDPVDALIIWEASSYPGMVIPCRIVGVLEVEQDRKREVAGRGMTA